MIWIWWASSQAPSHPCLPKTSAKTRPPTTGDTQSGISISVIIILHLEDEEMRTDFRQLANHPRNENDAPVPAHPAAERKHHPGQKRGADRGKNDAPEALPAIPPKAGRRLLNPHPQTGHDR